MSVVWSRQRVVQRTFRTTVSIAGLVLQVRSEGALCECHISMQIFLSHVFCAFKTRDVTGFVIDRDSRNNIFPQRSRG